MSALIDVDRAALACGLAGFRVWRDRGEHGPVRHFDPHREPGWMTCDFADGTSWAFDIGMTDPHEALQMFEIVAIAAGRLVRH